MPDSGVILFAHGSRDPKWRLPIEAVASLIEKQRDDVAVDPQPAVTMVEPQLTTPAATETRPADASGTRDNSGADRARAAIANRAPQPLAGNPVPAYPRSALRAQSCHAPCSR